ncbi:MAG: 4-alpha-glucanotransferase [Methanoregula sp.]|nr:4-alpha-glucanotransferase [Methanoregula sp.]
MPVIAEDLGVITPDVSELIDGFGLPGLRVLLFAFTGDPSRNP